MEWGIQRLADSLDLTFEDAKELIKKYHTEIPFVKEVSTSIQNRLKSPSSKWEHSFFKRA